MSRKAISNLSKSKIEEIRRLKLEGELSIKQIAKRVGVGTTAVSIHAGDIVSNPEVGKGKTSSDLIKKIRKLKSDGVGIAQISDETGVSVATVVRHTKDIPSADPYGGARKYSNKEIAEYYGIKEGDVTPKLRVSYSETQPIRRAKVNEASAAYRARLASATNPNLSAALQAEIDGIYEAAQLIPGKYDVDHIQRLIDDGLHHPKNLQLLSVELHNLKKALEMSGRFEDAARIGKFNLYDLSPNVRAVLAENVLEEKWGKKGLMNFLGDAYQNVKPGLKFAGKTLLRAAPFAGASLGVKAADDYRRSGQNKLAAAAAMSAIPGPIGWLGLGAEMGGLLWNKVTEDPNFLHRGILDDDQKRWTYTGRGRKRG